MKNAIVSFGSANNYGYVQGLNRLKKSLETYFDGDVLIWTNESDLNCPLHSENPYSFKIYAIEKAIEMGYTKILWLDSSVWAVKNIKPVFDIIKEKGIFLEDSGHYVGNWSNDECLQYFKITRENALKMPMTSGGFVGFNFEKPFIKLVFNTWKQSMIAGCFKGSWSDHRHDQSCLGIVVNQWLLENFIYPTGTYFSYIGNGYPDPKESAVCYLQGM